jgi:hypothetical protein
MRPKVRYKDRTPERLAEFVARVLKHPRCTGRVRKSLGRPKTEKGQWNYVLGVLECWNREAKAKRRFESRLVSGGLCNGR